MKKKLRAVLLAALGLVFAVSAVMLVRQNIQYQEGEEIYAEAEELASLPDLSGLELPTAEEDQTEAPAETKPVYVDPYADALRNMDFTALREVNSDVLGWILIPGTVVSYPVLQGADNQYYLSHTWKKWTSVVGAIFLEQYNSPDFRDFNTIVYGHRMNNGSMFASLKNYKKQSYWAAHPNVYITDDAGSRQYQVFAAYEVSTAGDTYRLSFSTEQAKQDFIDYCLAQSVIDTGIVPTVYDRVLTLSTCTGNGHATRWVVQAVLRGEAPSDTAQAAGETEPPAGLPDQTHEEEPAGDVQEPAAPEGGAEPSAEPQTPPETPEDDGELPIEP